MRQRWLSRRALMLHLALVVWVPGCLAAFWWQVHRAFSGNGLSYVYSVEWPVFAILGIWAWWQLVHTDPAAVGRRAQERLARADVGGAAGTAREAGAPIVTRTVAVASHPVRRPEDEDEALAAYNDRLARLATQGPKTWRNR